MQGDGAAVACGDSAGDVSPGRRGNRRGGGGGEGECELGGEGGEGGAGAFAEDAHGADVNEGGAGGLGVAAGLGLGVGGGFAYEEDDVEGGLDDGIGADEGITCVLQRLHVSIMKCLRPKARGARAGAEAGMHGGRPLLTLRVPLRPAMRGCAYDWGCCPGGLVERRVVILVLASLLGAGCAVGPNYQVPEIPVEGAYAPDGTAVSGGAATGAAWWRVLDDTKLDGLIAAAVANNLDLQQAAARVRERGAVGGGGGGRGAGGGRGGGVSVGRVEPQCGPVRCVFAAGVSVGLQHVSVGI